MTAEFWVTTLIVVLVPGTGVIYTISTALFKGWKAAMAAAVGCTLGIVPHLAACVLGLSAVMHMSAVAFQALKFAGAAYLLYLAWSMWRDSGAMDFEASDEKGGYVAVALRAVLINLLNPKLTIFFFAFLPMFVDAGAGSPLPQLLMLSLTFMALTGIVFALYGLLANSVRNWFLGSEKRIKQLRRSFAAAFAGLGIKLALTD